MGGLIGTWTALSFKSRAILLAAVIATFAGVILLASWAQRPTLGLLYAGIEPSDAGRIVGELEQMKVAYEVRGDAIFVDVAVRDRTRMSLAERGLPRRGPAGYELLDSLNSFGTTTEMFDATYWRAKEGELARSVLAIPGIIEARVHLANAKRRAFARQAESQSAAVTVRTAGGYTLEMRHALAIRYLVALAVAGLLPDQVAVIDADKGIVLKPGTENGSAAAMASSAEHEARLAAQITELLSARVGEGRVRVQVAVDIDRESEAVSERIVDPDSRVAIHSDNEELSESSTGGSRGSVTVSSNLPDGDAGRGAEAGSSNRSETRERVNYEVSETKRERHKEAGAVKRVSIAVLVDGIRTLAADGTETWSPRSDEELDAFRQLIQSSIGYSQDRGDVVTVETLQFADEAQVGGLIAQPGALDRLMDHVPQIIQAGILALVLILVMQFVIRPMLQRNPAGAAQPRLAGDGTAANDAVTAENAGENAQLTSGQTASASVPAVADAPPPSPPDPASVLKSVAGERPEEASALLKSWLASFPDQEEPA